MNFGLSRNKPQQKLISRFVTSGKYSGQICVGKFQFHPNILVFNMPSKKSNTNGSLNSTKVLSKTFTVFR